MLGVNCPLPGEVSVFRWKRGDGTHLHCMANAANLDLLPTLVPVWLEMEPLPGLYMQKGGEGLHRCGSDVMTLGVSLCYPPPQPLVYLRGQKLQGTRWEWWQNCSSHLPLHPHIAILLSLCVCHVPCSFF